MYYKRVWLFIPHVFSVYTMISKLLLIRGAFIAKSKGTNVAPGGFYIYNGSSGVHSEKLKRLCKVITNHLGYSCFYYLNMMLPF